MHEHRTLFTSESVTEGHPDKMCDQISDAVLDELLRQDPHSRVACEVAATTGLVLVMGEISTEGFVDIGPLARKVIQEIGYTDASYGFDYKTAGVMASIGTQSADIAQGVNVALERRHGEASDAELDAVGAGDQGMMFGFACTETPELMPLPLSLAHGLTRRLARLRKDGTLPYLRPDGKAQVSVEYVDGKPARIDTIVISTQHSADTPIEQIRADMVEAVIGPVVPMGMLDAHTRYFVNPTGRFVIGGPQGDAGLTGRKIIVDTYGGMARHGGGAFSGKDPTKVDRSASYAARWVAKNVVAAGLAERFEVRVAYAIGVAHPVCIGVESFGTAVIPEERIEDLIGEHFDLRPAAIINELDLRRPIYQQTASYGHFGRPDLDLPWERLDRAEALRTAAGLDALLASSL
ncbi:MAG: metK [Chloroflexi bacterium]|nr:metK [Chloroflexota bacterium]